MDNTTLGFLAVLVALFVAVKYLNSGPAPQRPAARKAVAKSRKASNVSSSTSGGRAVTKDMVEIVQQIGPSLTEEQIVYDLNKTGSIETTINNYLANGSLPPLPSTGSKKKNSGKKVVSTELERRQKLAEKKEDMIMKLRLRLKAQLTNEYELPTF